MKICINTQTPPLRFKLSYTELLEKYGSLGDPLEVQDLERGVDYDYSPGGVTAMVLPMLAHLSKSGFSKDPVWISLGVDYPPNVKLDDIAISHVELDENHLRDYASFKESFWSLIHGLGDRPFTREEYLGYVHYNWANAERLFHLVGDADVFFIQDFQLIQTGQLIGISAPAILRWHVPFNPENLGRTRAFVRKALEGFDSVIVSTKRDLEGLKRSSYRGHAYQIYPYIDGKKWKAVPRSVEGALKEKIRLRDDERLLLIVGRMDPIKSQDVAIRALAKSKGRTKLRLLMIGNGSFSSSQTGGLGRDKGAIWKEHLRAVARSLKVEDRTTFLGYASDDELRAAYQLASAVVLPSRIEGFGIAVLEAWINRKPVVVSKGAGASELVVEGSNGFTFEPGNAEGLAEGMLKAIGSPADRLGDEGFQTVKKCLVSESASQVKAALEETVAGFS
ncbi:MAG: glycosyltransferase family 4 protein [Thaumarchaeota archaeon]|nr:glycosyltransferase family 4 protein [Nitrososphaerota archaeon]